MGRIIPHLVRGDLALGIRVKSLHWPGCFPGGFRLGKQQRLKHPEQECGVGNGSVHRWPSILTLVSVARVQRRNGQ